MATVYLARDLKHDRQVALKVLRPDLAATLGPERFAREIAVAARLQHPHILGLLDSGDADGFFYYVMPYVEGETLRDRVARAGELPVPDAVRLLGEIAEALAVAHKAGVVHRDIKPENILLSGRHALVMDFGVAKAVSEASGRQQLTTAGVALGTPAYMAPEQASADPQMDGRVDIYALGVLGYEMLTGHTPFHGLTPQQTLAAHVTQAPTPVGQQRAGLSQALEAVVMKCLAKRPADRFQSADELAAALEPLATPSGGMTPTHTQPVAATSTAAGPRRRLKLLYAGVGIAAVAAAVWWLVNRPPAPAVLTSNTQLTRLAGVEEFPAISPDGKAVAYLAFGPSDSAPHVEYRRTAGGDAVEIAGAFRPNGWSPSGEQLLVSGPRGLESRPALGGQGTVVAQDALFACWSPDGKQVAWFVGDSLMVGGSNHAEPRLLTRALDAHSPAWSPDGKWIAFVSGNRRYFANYNIAPSSVWLVPAAGGTPWRLTSADAMNMSPTWAPDSRRLLIVSTLAGVRDVYQLDLTSGGRPRGAPVRISTGLNPSLISLSADGSQLAYSVATNHANIWKIAVPKSGSVSTRGALPVTNDLQTIENLDISRDGQWLVFDSDRQGVQQLFRMPLGGGSVQQITHDSIPSFRPSISPDAREVAFHTISQGLRRIYVVGMDGGQPTQLSPGAAPDERNASWSPDGRHVAWEAFGAGGRRVQVATRDGRGRWSAPTDVAFHGLHLALAWADSGTALIGVDSSWRYVVQPIDGGAFRRLSAGGIPESLKTGSRGALSSDGRLAYFPYDRGQRRGGVFALRLADGQSREVLRFDEPARPPSTAGNGIAEHGGWLYFILSDPESDIWVASVAGLKK
jgi:Tol biopolymer transport system component